MSELKRAVKNQVIKNSVKVAIGNVISTAGRPDKYNVRLKNKTLLRNVIGNEGISFNATVLVQYVQGKWTITQVFYKSVGNIAEVTV